MMFHSIARSTMFLQQRGPVSVLRVAQRTSLPTSAIAVREMATKVERPVSPHVTIYSFPLAAISSITHRITGTALVVGLYGMGFGSLLGMDVASSLATLGASSVGPLVKFSVAFPLTYHYIGALRILYWEKNPEGLSPETQKQSSALIFGVAGAIGGAAMFM